MSSARAAVIIGDRRDTHVQAVLAALTDAGAPEPLVVDGPTLRDHGYSLTLDQLTVEADETSLVGGRGWLRRYAPTAWGLGSIAGSLDSAARRSYLYLVGSITRLGARQWLTSLSPLLAAEDRLVQLEACRELGLPAPDTIVTSDGNVALEFFDGPFVVKPLAGGYYVTDHGKARAVFTSEIDRQELGSLDFAHAPFLAQRLVAAIAHFRIVTVGDQAWTARLDAAGRPVDWRAQEEAHYSWEANPDPVTEKLALRLAQHLNVGYSSQDWVVGPDGPWFIDLNPAGQWLFLPDSIALATTTAIAEFLAGP